MIIVQNFCGFHGFDTRVGNLYGLQYLQNHKNFTIQYYSILPSREQRRGGRDIIQWHKHYNRVGIHGGEIISLCMSIYGTAIHIASNPLLWLR